MMNDLIKPDRTLRANQNLVLLVGGPFAGRTHLIEKHHKFIVYLGDRYIGSSVTPSGAWLLAPGAESQTGRTCTYSVVARGDGVFLVDLATCNGDNIDAALMEIVNYYATENCKARGEE